MPDFLANGFARINNDMAAMAPLQTCMHDAAACGFHATATQSDDGRTWLLEVASPVNTRGGRMAECTWIEYMRFLSAWYLLGPYVHGWAGRLDAEEEVNEDGDTREVVHWIGSADQIATAQHSLQVEHLIHQLSLETPATIRMIYENATKLEAERSEQRRLRRGTTAASGAAHPGDVSPSTG